MDATYPSVFDAGGGKAGVVVRICRAHRYARHVRDDRCNAVFDLIRDLLCGVLAERTSWNVRIRRIGDLRIRRSLCQLRAMAMPGWPQSWS